MNVIWFDENYDNEENTGYINELKGYHNLKIKCFKDIEEGMKYIKTIEFVETNIIISGRLYGKFIDKFKEELKDIYIIPKIIIFTKNKDTFLKNNNEYKNYIDNSFYNLGGIKTIFKDIKDFILKPLNKKIMNRDDEGHLTFEYIDCEEKLYYPILYKALIDTTRIDNIDIFTSKIYNEYKKKSTKIKNLLNTIENIQNIPVELLSKYYARLYTIESDFYKDINNDLRNDQKENYLTFIKILYEGVKLKALELAEEKISSNPKKTKIITEITYNKQNSDFEFINPLYSENYNKLFYKENCERMWKNLSKENETEINEGDIIKLEFKNVKK